MTAEKEFLLHPDHITMDDDMVAALIVYYKLESEKWNDRPHIRSTGYVSGKAHRILDDHLYRHMYGWTDVRVERDFDFGNLDKHRELLEKKEVTLTFAALSDLLAIFGQVVHYQYDNIENMVAHQKKLEEENNE